MTNQTLVERLRKAWEIAVHLVESGQEWADDAQQVADLLDAAIADVSALTGQDGAAPSPRAEGSTDEQQMRESVAQYLAELRDAPIGQTDRIRSLRGRIVTLACILFGEPPAGTEPAAQPPSVEARYWELLYAVSRKHPGESRHETALRYIQQAEQPSGGACACEPGERTKP